MDHFINSTSAVTGCIIILLGLVFLPGTVEAQSSQGIEIDSDIDAQTVDRFTESDVIRMIATSDESVNLIVAEEGIAIQFTDKFLNEMEDEINSSEEGNGDSSAFADVIKSMVGSGIRTLLNHAIVIPFNEISTIRYDDGHVFIMDLNGNEIFDELEINDTQVMDDFSRRDARRFVADAERRLV